MLSRFRQWLAENRARREAHARAWDSVIEPKADGLSPFQHMAADALCKAIPSIELARTGQSETYLTGSIAGGNAKVFIYHCQAEVFGGPELFPGEYQDYDCPDDLIRDFVATARRAGAA